MAAPPSGTARPVSDGSGSLPVAAPVVGPVDVPVDSAAAVAVDAVQISTASIAADAERVRLQVGPQDDAPLGLREIGEWVKAAVEHLDWWIS
eukprot:gene24091-41028_t